MFILLNSNTCLRIFNQKAGELINNVAEKVAYYLP